MGLRNQISQFKIWLSCGGELLWIRLRMLRLDGIAQMRSLVCLFIAIMVVATAFFLGFICLLFGLNTVLPPLAKIWVFFGLALIFVLLIVYAAFWALRLWQQQGSFMEDTLNAMSEDIAYLKSCRPGSHANPSQEQRHE